VIPQIVTRTKAECDGHCQPPKRCANGFARPQQSRVAAEVRTGWDTAIGDYLIAWWTGKYGNDAGGVYWPIRKRTRSAFRFMRRLAHAAYGWHLPIAKEQKLTPLQLFMATRRCADERYLRRGDTCWGREVFPEQF